MRVSCLVRALRSESLCSFGCEAVGQNGACPSLPSLLIPLQVKEDCIYLLPGGVDSVVEAGSAVVVAGHVFAALHFFGTALRRGALCPPRRRPVVVAFRRTLLLSWLAGRRGGLSRDHAGETRKTAPRPFGCGRRRPRLSLNLVLLLVLRARSLCPG